MENRDRVSTFPGGERFELVAELGRGGMGVVYEVRDRDRRVRLALKGLRRVGPRAILRLKHEFRAVRDLQHANLVRLDELFEQEGAWFYTMELVDGVEFLRWVRPDDPHQVATTSGGETAATRADGLAARWVRAADTESLADGAAASWTHRAPAVPCERGFDEARLRAAMRGLVAGVAALHRAGMVHRDVKPSNVLVEPGGRVVVLDFGVVTEVAGPRVAPPIGGHELVGTYGYMAPEQASADDVGPAADWYAVGAMLFEAMTGDLPFTGPDGLQAKLAVEAPSPRSWSADLPDDLVALCERLLRRDPAARPSAAELLAFFEVDADASGASFVGRAGELSTLRAAFDAVLAGGRARAVFVAGDSGIGKSALARRFVDELGVARTDLLVLGGRCDARELVPYNALDGAVDALARYLTTLPADQVPAPEGTRELLRIFPVLRGVGPLDAAARATPLTPVLDPRAVAFAALGALIGLVASRRAVIVLVDDVHWADADSLALLRELFAGGDAPPVLLLATARGTPEAPIAARIAIAVPSEVIELGGLAPAEAEALVRAAAPGADAARLAADTGGHPMFLAELAHRLGDGGAHGLRLDDALWQRIGELDAGARALLEVVALGAAPLPVGAVPAAAGLGPEGFARALAGLRAARLVRVTGSRDHDAIEPYHDRVRETVAARLDADHRRAIHRAIVSSLESAGAGVEVLAYHLAEAGDGARAASLAEAAARRAHDALAFDRAAEWLRLVLELGELAPERRAALRVDLADALARAGRTADAADAYLAAAGDQPVEAARELRRRAAEELLIGGHLARGRAVADALAAEIGIGVPRSTTAAIARLLWYQARLAWSRLQWPHRTAEETSALDRIRIDAAWSIATGLSMVDSTRGTVLAMRGPLLAMPSGDPVRIARAICAAAVGSAGMAQRRLATRLRDAAHRAAAESDDPMAGLYAAFTDVAYHFYLDNDFYAARVACQHAATLLPDGRGHTFEADVIEQHHVWSLNVLGELRELRRRVPPSIRSAQRLGNRFIEISFRTFFPIVHLIVDRPVQALADVRDAVESWQVEGDEVTNPFFFGLKSRSLIALYAGDLESDLTLDDDWARLRASLLFRIPIIHAEATQWLGMIEVARAAAARDRGNGAARDEHVASARRWSRRCRRVCLPFATQLADTLDACIAAAAGDVEGAVAALTASIQHLDATHQRSVAAASRWRLAQLVGGDAGAAHRAEAARFYAAEGVLRPERLVDGLLPGW